MDVFITHFSTLPPTALGAFWSLSASKIVQAVWTLHFRSRMDFLRCKRTYYVPVPMYVVRRCKSAEWIGSSPGKASRSPFLLFAFFFKPSVCNFDPRAQLTFFLFQRPPPLVCSCAANAWLALVRLCKAGKASIPTSLGRIKKREWVHYDKEAISIKPPPSFRPFVFILIMEWPFVRHQGGRRGGRKRNGQNLTRWKEPPLTKKAVGNKKGKRGGGRKARKLTGKKKRKRSLSLALFHSRKARRETVTAASCPKV